MPHEPPLEDGAGGFFYMSRPRWPGDMSAKAAKKLRNDVLTSVAAVLREAAHRWPRCVMGTGHGALVALSASFPRLVEAALSLRYAREADGAQLAEVWANIRVFVCICPRHTARQGWPW